MGGSDATGEGRWQKLDDADARAMILNNLTRDANACDFIHLRLVQRKRMFWPWASSSCLACTEFYFDVVSERYVF